MEHILDKSISTPRFIKIDRCILIHVGTPPEINKMARIKLFKTFQSKVLYNIWDVGH